jgi:hypothetical protein
MKELVGSGRSTGYYLWYDDSASEYIDKYQSGLRKGDREHFLSLYHLL